MFIFESTQNKYYELSRSRVIFAEVDRSISLSATEIYAGRVKRRTRGFESEKARYEHWKSRPTSKTERADRRFAFAVESAQ